MKEIIYTKIESRKNLSYIEFDNEDTNMDSRIQDKSYNNDQIYLYKSYYFQNKKIYKYF